MEAQGWYRDPYARHEARWYSAGRATSLVRDGSVESHDDPPSDPAPCAPGELAELPAEASPKWPRERAGISAWAELAAEIVDPFT